jgi:hypothetical protein
MESAAELIEKIKLMPDDEKLKIVDQILTHLDKTDPDIDRVWAEEAGRRWNRYKAGVEAAVAYDSVMSGYRRK